MPIVRNLGYAVAVLVPLLLVGTTIAQTQITDYCRVKPLRSDALDSPSKHAWSLFMVINHPALDRKVGRGLSDCFKPIGTPGTTAVWETWRNAATEVFLDKGVEPPNWDDISLPDEKPGTVPSIPDAPAEELMLSAHDFGSRALSTTDAPPFSPGDGVFNDRGGFGETRMNRSTYEFIRKECLFSRQGQQRYAAAVKDKKKPPIVLPSDSIEVKAAWLDFEKEKIPPEKWSTYYSAEYKGKRYGLVALHIITKDIPNWFWASFHHKDAPENKFETDDAFGQPSEIQGTVWENYVLGGTQIDFVKPTGSATLLSDHYVEFGFQKSSCITCHATAAISETTPISRGQEIALCSIMPELMDIKECKALIGESAFFPGTDNLVIERGVPNPEWFMKDAKQYFQQSDFLWSIPFRGKLETVTPPQRCVW